MYSHNSKSLFNYSSDLYQLRRFLLLSSFELQNFKQTAGSYTNFFNSNFFVQSVLISRQALFHLLVKICSMPIAVMLL